MLYPTWIHVCIILLGVSFFLCGGFVGKFRTRSGWNFGLDFQIALMLMGIRNFPCNHWDRLPTSTGARRIPEPSTVTSHLESKMELSVWVLRPEAVKKNPSWKEIITLPETHISEQKWMVIGWKMKFLFFFFPFSAPKKALSFPGNFEKITPVTLSKETPAAVRRTRQLQRQSTVPWRYEGGTWVTRLSGGFFGVFFVFFPDSFARQRCLIITNLTCTYSKLTSH